MDPDTALVELSIAIHDVRYHAMRAEAWARAEVDDTGLARSTTQLVDAARGLADRTEALDDWLSRGGFPPAAWAGPNREDST